MARFFSFDGVDGVGKTTQIQLFVAWLEEQGQTVVTCRDPGSTDLGNVLRNLVLDHHGTRIGRHAEMFLYMAARAQLVDEVIRPALKSGKTVVSDRFLLANVVYQGHAGGLPVAELWRVGQLATQGFTPDLTFVLDLDVQRAIERRGREPDRMEAQGDQFLAAVCEGFRREAAAEASRVIIDASGTPDEVHRRVRAVVESKRGPGPQPKAS